MRAVLPISRPRSARDRISMAYRAASLMSLGCTKIHPPFQRSLGAKGLYNVDAGGAGGREPRRDDRGCKQHERREDHGQGARHLHVWKIVARQTREHEPECRACEETGPSHHSAVGDDSFQEKLRLRSKSQAYAEFTRPRTDRKRQHAGDANQSNRQRNSREDAEHQGIQAVRREHLRADVFESGSVLDGLIGGHVANNAGDRRDERIRICAGVDEKVAAKDGTLFKGAIDGDDGLGNDVFVVNIGSHADDAVRRGVNPGSKLHHRVGPIDMPADSILIGEHALCESLADDSHWLFTLAVEIVEIAAAKDRYSERSKESRGNDAQLRARVLARGKSMPG